MNSDWAQFLSAMLLVLVRVSGIVAFAPFFSSTAFPVRTKVIFAVAVSYVLSPVVAAGPRAELSLLTLVGELGFGLVYGLSLALLNEMLLFAGQIAGMQFSFSLVNLLDPSSSIQTPLLGELFQLMGTLTLLAAGLDRLLLASLARSLREVPAGSFAMTSGTSAALVRATGGMFLAALQLAAPVLAATLLVEVAIALLGKLSPQLPVMSLTVPAKTITGFVLLVGSLALWPRFIEARFEGLLEFAERLVVMHTVAR